MSHPAFRAVVPSSDLRAKRIAKTLKLYYPNESLMRCQAITAQLFGHADWFHMVNAINLGLASAPYDDDEDLDDEQWMQRTQAQKKILSLELGGVTLSDGITISEDPRTNYIQMLAGDLIDELTPTSRRVPPKLVMGNLFAEVPMDVVAELPVKLGRWWLHNLSEQPEVGEALTNYKLDVNSAPSLLKFGYYCGKLFFHYGQAINWTVVMGISCMLAERYADLQLLQIEPSTGDEEDVNLANSSDPLTQAKKVELHQAIAARYLTCSCREDLYPVYLNQPKAFKKNAKACLKIFANPTSRAGKW